MNTTLFQQSDWLTLICMLELLLISYHCANGVDLLTDINVIRTYWSGQQAYPDNPEDVFGVEDTGLPDGCQIEQLQIYHRHSIRYPSTAENVVTLAFAAKVTALQSSQNFSGPLSFLNTWTLEIGNNVLMANGISIAYRSGVDFWRRNGRLLFNAAPDQTFYNGTGQTKPVLRASTLPRVYDTARAWIEGFFGPNNASSQNTLLAIPFVSTQNSSLSSFLSCLNYGNANGALFTSQPPITATLPYYLNDTVTRLSQYMPANINLTVADAFAMQALCTYEFYALGSSDFCYLFTLDEWKGFDYVYDSLMYNSASYGSPAGRAIGIGFLQEILARLQGQYINSSQTSINSTMDSNPATFPLNEKIYFDATNDFMLLGTVAAMSVDYFKGALPLVYPRPDNRTFRLSRITSYAGHLSVEKIGCASANPTAKSGATQYTNNQYGYSVANATYKFVRIRLNNGIVPLNTIRGGLCNITGRTDGLCPLNNFVQSQANATVLANYQYLCFANFTYNVSKFTGDGTYFG